MSDFDIEVIIDDDEPLTKEFTFAVRTELTGTKIGPLVLEAQVTPSLPADCPPPTAATD